MAAQNPLTVLYVDDDEDTRRSISWIFQAEGIHVREAASGTEALRLADEKPDIVVLDVNLPDINGFEVCRRIKAQAATRSIPVLHVSACFVSSEDRTHGLEEGADGYLTKPVEPRELIAHIRALTRIHRAEEAARAAAHHWQVTFDAMSDGVCLLDPQGRVTRCNSSFTRLVGKAPAEIVGQLHQEYAPGKDTDELFARMLRSGRRELAEATVGQRSLQAVLEPIPGPHGSEGAVFILSDVTERKRLEAQLVQAQKMEAVGQLAGGVAHDFNNLLTGLLGNLALVLATTSPDSPHRELLEGMDKVGWRAAELVKQLLGFSRRSALWLRPLHVGDSVKEIIGMLQRTLDPRIQVEARIAPDLWLVDADATQLSQVLLNLSLNARDAMPQGGSLLLEVENIVLDSESTRGQVEARPGEFVRLTVTDSGQGIPADNLPHIFEPFFTTKQKGQGTGLGLAMVFGIVQQHRGWVECWSEVGRGTRLRVYLPRRSSAAEVHAASSPPSPVTGKETILLVEDEPMVRGIGRRFLQHHGYHVLLAEDGLQALTIYRENCQQIDLVILDLIMPHLSGQETLRALRKINPAVRVLVTSGFPAEQTNIAALEGVHGFLQKPFREADLANMVRTVLNKSG